MWKIGTYRKFSDFLAWKVMLDISEIEMIEFRARSLLIGKNVATSSVILYITRFHDNKVVLNQ